MHKRSFRFSILLIILTLFVGFGVFFVAPKPVKAGALEDFVAQLTLGDFIRNLFQGLFGGTRGEDNPYPPTPTPGSGSCDYSSLADCTGSCTGGTCTNTGCNSGRYKCVPRPTTTPVPTGQQCNFTSLVTCYDHCSANNCTDSGCAAGTYKCIAPVTSTPTPPGVGCIYNSATECNSACGAQGCSSYDCPTGKYRCAGPTATPTPRQCPFFDQDQCRTQCNSACTSYGCYYGSYRCWPGAPTLTPTATPTPGCSMTSCGATSCPSGQGCVLCDNSKYRCGALPTNTPRPTATITVRPTATSVPNLSPTVTVGAGTPPPSPYPTNTSVPYPTQPPGPPGATATPTTPVGAACYYNVRLVNANGAVEPSALQTGTTEAGGCRTQGVRELVPSFYTQPSTTTNNPEWPCTDADYVGQSCTQGIVTGQFICMGGPQHEIKGCYNRTSDAYQRVSIVQVTQSGATATPTIALGATNTPVPIHSSFQNWFSEFITYINTPGTPYSLSLTVLEDWRDNTPGPTPTPPTP